MSTNIIMKKWKRTRSEGERKRDGKSAKKAEKGSSKEDFGGGPCSRQKVRMQIRKKLRFVSLSICPNQGGKKRGAEINKIVKKVAKKTVKKFLENKVVFAKSLQKGEPLIKNKEKGGQSAAGGSILLTITNEVVTFFSQKPVRLFQRIFFMITEKLT